MKILEAIEKVKTWEVPEGWIRTVMFDPDEMKLIVTASKSGTEKAVATILSMTPDYREFLEPHMEDLRLQFLAHTLAKDACRSNGCDGSACKCATPPKPKDPIRERARRALHAIGFSRS
jgi:hypothetical protein